MALYTINKQSFAYIRNHLDVCKIQRKVVNLYIFPIIFVEETTSISTREPRMSIKDSLIIRPN